ncbi:unnamed protein product [Pieris brassicae]|uniref:Uncharacterized protein n=1 Tax=Pieris brassicae TaxID=7116 RepID=A0A9P0T426_PIEBR|nr:unnamed protein product [Pieris brassicae]
MFRPMMSNMVVYKLKQRLQHVCDMSNLHGIKHICSSSNIYWPKRFFWLTILSACCFGAGSVLRSSLRLLSSDVMSYSVDTNYLDWDTPYPTVTVCEQLDTNRIMTYLKRNDLPNSLSTFFKEVTFWNMKYCRTCTKCDMNKTCVEGFVDDIKRIRLNCSNLLSECWWDNQYFPCCDRFQPVETEYGECFSFNSVVNENTVLTVNKETGTPSLIFTTVDASMIRIHASDEIVSVDMENILGRTSTLPLLANLEAILKVEQTVNDASVRSVSTKLRSCLFKNEKPLYVKNWPFKLYTYSAYEIGKFNCSCPMGCDETSYKVTHQSWPGWTKDSVHALNLTCDKAECSSPCNYAAPPTYCPTILPNCSSGCVCMLQCQAPVITCFKLKYCQKKRWFLRQKKHN